MRPSAPALEDHLAGCAACRTARDEIHALLAGLAHTAEDPGEAYFESLANRVMNTVRDEPRGFAGRLRAWFGFLWWQPVTVGAMAFLAVAGAVWLWNGFPAEEGPTDDAVVRAARRYAYSRQLQLEPVAELALKAATTTDADDDSASEPEDVAVTVLIALGNDEEVLDQLEKAVRPEISAGAFLEAASMNEEDTVALTDHLREAMESWSI
ncbi:MAG: hypothetical protein M5R36_12785 [Deltaproteobacteria bacterium]|nr:hypothetical protein [Deltaproteobacteria bacterium]